jgi:hypothetical protein
MAGDCTWGGWQTNVQWDKEVAPGIKIRLEGFFDRVLPTLDTLARRVDGARDVDALAALLQRLGPMPSPWADDMLMVPREWSASRADAARVTNLMRNVDHVLEREPEPIQSVVAMLLTERILRAVLVSRIEHLDDPDGVLTAANLLEQQVRQVLVFVCTGQVSASDYRLM